MDETAARTYRLNHPGVPDEHVLVQDIRTLPKEALKRLVGRRPLDVNLRAVYPQASHSLWITLRLPTRYGGSRFNIPAWRQESTSSS